MKKIGFVTLAVAGLIALAMTGCKNGISIDDTTTFQIANEPKSDIAKNIAVLKEAGLFEELLTNSSRNAVCADNEIKSVHRFITNTDEVLAEIETEENGSEQIKVINALFGGGSTEDFYNAFYYLDAEKAGDFLNAINEIEENQFQANNKAVARSVASSQKLNLTYYPFQNEVARGAYASNLEWSTIGWYTGFCAATIAGMYAASYGGFWVRIAGIAAASAGTASMVIQLKKWADCSQLITFLSKLKSQDAQGANQIFQTEDGKKLLFIISETAATVVACAISPVGRSVIKVVTQWYNCIINKILTILPSGINWVICEIPIKNIVITL